MPASKMHGEAILSDEKLVAKGNLEYETQTDVVVETVSERR